MAGLLASLALLPAAAFATSVLQAASGARIVNIVFQANKVTSDTAIDVWNQDKSERFAQSCSHTLTTGPFEKTPLTFDVNEHGNGNITIGDKTYMIHDNPDLSGGIVCSSIVSEFETLINCEAPVAESLKLWSLSKRTLKDCFPEGPLELAGVMHKLENTPKGAPLSSPEALAAIQVRQTNTTEDHTTHDKRQGSCGCWSSTMIRVGDGNPHQNPLNVNQRLPPMKPQPEPQPNPNQTLHRPASRQPRVVATNGHRIRDRRGRLHLYRPRAGILAGVLGRPGSN